MLEGLNKGQPKLGIGKSSKVDLIKQVNNRKIIKICRKDGCECDLDHRRSKKQMKKKQRLVDRDGLNLDLESKLKQDVNKLMTGMNDLEV